MNIQDFRILGEVDQLSYIMQTGHLMAQSQVHEFRVFLYRIENFYVATTYHLSTDQLKHIESFPEAESAFIYLQSNKLTTEPAARVYETPER